MRSFSSLPSFDLPGATTHLGAIFRHRTCISHHRVHVISAGSLMVDSRRSGKLPSRTTLLCDRVLFLLLAALSCSFVAVIGNGRVACFHRRSVIDHLLPEQLKKLCKGLSEEEKPLARIPGSFSLDALPRLLLTAPTNGQVNNTRYRGLKPQYRRPLLLNNLWHSSAVWRCGDILDQTFYSC